MFNDEFIEMIASVAHEANREYCFHLGDFSQPTWKDAPEWQKKSAITGVRFHLENPGAPPSASHDSWLKEKVEDGWVYGTVKDPEKKTHPCVQPYEFLPLEQKIKDMIFTSIVRGFINS